MSRVTSGLRPLLEARRTPAGRFSPRAERMAASPETAGAAARGSHPAARGSTAALLLRAERLGHRPGAYATVQRGLASSKSDDDLVLQKEYEKYIGEANEKLSGKIGFGASPEGKFDKENWEPIKDEEYKYALKCKVKPSKAVQDLYDNAEKWSFDCAEYVQVINLYAALKVYGKKKMDELAPEKFILRQHSSPGLGEKSPLVFQREDPKKKFDLVLEKYGKSQKKEKPPYLEDFIDEDTLLKAIPLGSRVTFRNPIGKDTPYRNENTLKDGSVTFSAHPMGKGLSRSDVIDQLVKKNLELVGKEGRDEIYIGTVEIYDVIPIGKSTHKALGTDKLVDLGYL